MNHADHAERQRGVAAGCSPLARRNPMPGCAVPEGRSPRETQAALRAGGGGRGLRQRKEREEALDLRPVALDPHVPRAQSLVEPAALVDQRPQRAGIALDHRVGPLRYPALDLETTPRDLGPKPVLPDPELVARLEPLRSDRVEHRPQREDEGIDAQRGVAGSQRGAGTPASQPDEDRKSTLLNSSHANISYAVFCLKKKT